MILIEIEIIRPDGSLASGFVNIGAGTIETLYCFHGKFYLGIFNHGDSRLEITEGSARKLLTGFADGLLALGRDSDAGPVQEIARILDQAIARMKGKEVRP